MGDCGAFTYVREESTPPYTVDEVIDFYEELRLRRRPVARPRHPRLRTRSAAERGPAAAAVGATPGAHARTRRGVPAPAPRARMQLSSRSASRRAGARDSYAEAVAALQRSAIERIALGGLVAAEDPRDPRASSTRSRESASRRTELHLLGVTRCEQIPAFRELRRDELRQHLAVSPGLQGRPRQLLRRRTRMPGAARASGRGQREAAATHSRRRDRQARRLADSSSDALSNAGRLRPRRCRSSTMPSTRFASTRCSTTTTRDRSRHTARCSRRAPWKRCDCAVCRDAGIQVIIFRGTERNKRRGFHNLHVFARRLRAAKLSPKTRDVRGRALTRAEKGPDGDARARRPSARDPSGLRADALQLRCRRQAAPAIRGRLAGAARRRPSRTRRLSARRVARRTSTTIRKYLETEDAILPNALVVAFDSRVRFEPAATRTRQAAAGSDAWSSRSTKTRPDDDKPGWIVDGQQRSAAIRDADVERFPVYVTAFITDSVAEQRSQFILVNSDQAAAQGSDLRVAAGDACRGPAAAAAEAPLSRAAARSPELRRRLARSSAGSVLRRRPRARSRTTRC